MSAFSSVVSLLLSTALLLIGHGMQLTLLPLRAGANGMSDFMIGVSASCYFLGFVVGCLGISPLLARVGHIRGFAVLTAVMICAVLSLEMLDNVSAWLLLRFLTGAAICGLYTVIESWLNSQSSSSTRGRILALYTFITLIAILAGQILINVGPVEVPAPFMLAGLFLALSIIPVCMTSRMAPAPLERTKFRFSLLYERSQSAFAGALLSGLVVGSFWSLGAIFASNSSGASQADVTWFMSAAIGGGALLQYPIGWLSDRVDRRLVLLCLCLTGALASAAVAISTDHPLFLVAVFLFGATLMPVYAVALATAADVSSSDEFVGIGTSVLLLHALGAALAPVPLGKLMTLFGADVLFLSFSAICGLFALLFFGLTRVPRAVSVSEQTPFSAAASHAAPVSFELDPRAAEQNHDAPKTENSEF